MPARLLPFNTGPLEQALEQVVAERLESIPLPIGMLWDPAQCPADLLPWLAWALSIDTWDSDWPDQIKRAVIAGSMAQHRQKGTVAAVKEALSDIGVDFELIEWFDDGGVPHTFQLLTDAVAHWCNGGRPLDTRVFADLQASIDPVKPVRSHYTARLKVGSANRLGLANKASQFTVMRLRLPLMLNLQSTLGFAAASVPIAHGSVSMAFSNSEGLLLPAPVNLLAPAAAVLHSRVTHTLQVKLQALPRYSLNVSVPISSSVIQRLNGQVRL